MKIVKLEAENIKKLKAISIDTETLPDSSVITISGKNSQGKTSVLDSIWFALGGSRATKDTPQLIREGESSAQVTLDLGDITVHRKWTEKSKTLEVTNSSGKPFKSPQAILDNLLGQFTFDPLSFIHLPAPDQLSTLLSLAGLTSDLNNLDQSRSDTYNERTIINRLLKEKSGHLTSLTPPPPDFPTEPIDLAPLHLKHQSAIEHNINLKRDTEKLNDLRFQRDSLANQIKKMEEELDTMKSLLIKVNGEGLSLAKTIENNTPIDLEPINNQIKEATNINNLITQYSEFLKVQSEVTSLKQDSDNLTDTIKNIDDKKCALLSIATLPIPELTISPENTILYNDLPLSQASASEQLKASISIAMALNPDLRIIRITDGSLLDSDNLALISSLTHSNDYQIWIEMVSDEPGKYSIFIEDGEVIS